MRQRLPWFKEIAATSYIPLLQQTFSPRFSFHKLCKFILLLLGDIRKLQSRRRFRKIELWWPSYIFEPPLSKMASVSFIPKHSRSCQMPPQDGIILKGIHRHAYQFSQSKPYGYVSYDGFNLTMLRLEFASTRQILTKTLVSDTAPQVWKDNKKPHNAKTLCCAGFFPSYLCNIGQPCLFTGYFALFFFWFGNFGLVLSNICGEFGKSLRVGQTPAQVRVILTRRSGQSGIYCSDYHKENAQSQMVYGPKDNIRFKDFKLFKIQWLSQSQQTSEKIFLYSR